MDYLREKQPDLLFASKKNATFPINATVGKDGKPGFEPGTLL